MTVPHPLVVAPKRHRLPAPASAEILCWGSHAARFVERRASASLVAVFGRSLHLEAEGDFLCIGDASIGNGPLNATVDAAGWVRVAKRLPRAGAEVRINAGTIEMGDAVLSAAAASMWRPPAWPRVAGIEGLAVALDELVRCAREQAPADGLARIVLGPAGEPASAFERIARPRVRRMQQWVSARLSGPLHEPAPVDLLGLGPGLTPSGDDLLCGALVALHAIGRTDAGRDLDAAIARSAPSATSRLSMSFLRAAAEGQGYAALHTMIVALLENRTFARELEALARIGHTSGWDALAGAAIVLQAFSAAVIPGLVPGTQRSADDGAID
jgi:uncharacterized protein DUF2877